MWLRRGPCIHGIGRQSIRHKSVRPPAYPDGCLPSMGSRGLWQGSGETPEWNPPPRKFLTGDASERPGRKPVEGPREMKIMYEDLNYVVVDKPFDFRLVRPMAKRKSAPRRCVGSCVLGYPAQKNHPNMKCLWHSYFVADPSWSPAPFRACVG